MNIIQFFQTFWPQIIIGLYAIFSGLSLNKLKQLNPTSVILITIFQYAILYRGGMFEIIGWGHLVWIILGLIGWYDILVTRKYQTTIYRKFSLIFTPIMSLLIYYWCGFFDKLLNYLCNNS